MTDPYETCPYRQIPAYSRWADAVGQVDSQAIDPHTEASFGITRDTRIATAGSCFAQNLSRALVQSGFHFHCVEPAPPWLEPAQRDEFNYGVFSARYGNVYTPRQLLQLFQRALGQFDPVEPAWVEPDGRVVDPFRPRIQRHGFASQDEMLADRTAHLAAVRAMMETLEVFVFTLGLTESWRSCEDGAIFPVAPGCGAGRFDAARHEFHNFRVHEVINDLTEALALLRSVNPRSQVILTVSPVALQATMEPRHVLQSTVYSKSVLRTAAGEVAAAEPSVTYFASYEIATATLNNAHYFAADKRSVTSDCVDHVMRCFFRLFAPNVAPQTEPVARTDVVAPRPAAKVICDEDAIAEALAGQRA
jgi:hypothetical protein